MYMYAHVHVHEHVHVHVRMHTCSTLYSHIHGCRLKQAHTLYMYMSRFKSVRVDLNRVLIAVADISHETVCRKCESVVGHGNRTIRSHRQELQLHVSIQTVSHLLAAKLLSQEQTQWNIRGPATH